GDEAEGVIDAIEAHHGLLIKQAKDLYSFSHLTLHEFFTANFVRESIRSQQGLVNTYLGEEKWREVFIGVAHLIGDADDYVTWILSKMESLGFTGEYLPLMRA